MDLLEQYREHVLLKEEGDYPQSPRHISPRITKNTKITIVYEDGREVEILLISAELITERDNVSTDSFVRGSRGIFGRYQVFGTRRTLIFETTEEIDTEGISSIRVSNTMLVHYPRLVEIELYCASPSSYIERAYRYTFRS